MPLQNRTGPPTRNRRAPRKRASWRAARASNSSTPLIHQGLTAAELIRRMKDAGAVFSLVEIRPRDWRYRYQVKPSSARAQQCRDLFRIAKEGTPEYLAQVRVQIFCEIMRVRLGLAESDP